MNQLDLHLATTPPQELFHYTSQEGLIGIACSRSIWASQISHLNDSAELLLSLRLAAGQVRQMADGWIRDELLNLIDCMEHSAGWQFVFSLTEEMDQLSQWRGYTRPGSGYSIGFYSKFLERAAREWDFTLGPCCYEESAQKAIVAEIVSDAIDRRRSREPPKSPRSKTAKEPFCDALLFAAPFLKHRSFSEEREWRLVSRRAGIPSERLKHRPGRSYIVPYLELKFDDLDLRDSKIPLSTIVVGPTPHPGVAGDSLETLFLGNFQPEIRASRVPYREW